MNAAKKSLLFVIVLGVLAVAITFFVRPIDQRLFPRDYARRNSEALYIVGTVIEPAGMKPGEKYVERGPDGKTTTKEAVIVAYYIGTANGKILFAVEPFGLFQGQQQP